MDNYNSPGFLVTYNINNGVQIVGHAVDPPPYSEVMHFLGNDIFYLILREEIFSGELIVDRTRHTPSSNKDYLTLKPKHRQFDRLKFVVTLVDLEAFHLLYLPFKPPLTFYHI